MPRNTRPRAAISASGPSARTIRPRSKSPIPASVTPEFLPKVLDLFAQGDRSLDRSQGGLGIGLAVCKKLVEMHDGTVTASRAGPGRGATFKSGCPSPSRRPIRPRRRSPHPRRPGRVLIVDDDQDPADSLAMLLELDGHDVRAVYSAMDALEQVIAFAPRSSCSTSVCPG